MPLRCGRVARRTVRMPGGRRSAFLFALATTLAVPATLSAAFSAPTNATAVAISPGQIDLTWTDTSSNEQSQRIERSVNQPSAFVQIANLPPNVETYHDTDVAEGTIYY